MPLASVLQLSHVSLFFFISASVSGLTLHKISFSPALPMEACLLSLKSQLKYLLFWETFSGYHMTLFTSILTLMCLLSLPLPVSPQRSTHPVRVVTWSILSSICLGLTLVSTAEWSSSQPSLNEWIKKGDTILSNSSQRQPRLLSRLIILYYFSGKLFYLWTHLTNSCMVLWIYPTSQKTL